MYSILSYNFACINNLYYLINLLSSLLPFVNNLIIDIQEICTLNLASIGRSKIISPQFLFGLPTIIEKHLYFIIIYLLLFD